MKNRLYSIAVFAVILIPFVAPWEGAGRSNGQHAAEGIRFHGASQNASSFMPVLDVEMSDLDARDARNRPINGSSSSQVLRDLFISSLFKLSVVDELHGLRQIWSDLQLYSHLFRDLIFNVFHPLWCAVPLALQPAIKRFVHNVHNVWIPFLVGVFLCGFLTLKTSRNTSLQHLILRC